MSARPRRPATSEAYRRALLLPVQPWKRQWVAPLNGAPGLKILKWVKSDEKLQWSDEEDDAALEHALGVALEAEQDQDGDGLIGDDDLDGVDDANNNMNDPASFPVSGAATPKDDSAAATPHPVLQRTIRQGNDDDDDMDEEGDDENDEEDEEGDEEDEEEGEFGEGEGDGEGEREGQGEATREGGEEDGPEDDEGDDDLNMPRSDFEAEPGDILGGSGDMLGDAGDLMGSQMMPEGFYEGGLNSLPGLHDVTQGALMEGEDMLNQSGDIDDVLGQNPLDLAPVDDPDDVFM